MLRHDWGKWLFTVAPLAGAWIEMGICRSKHPMRSVAPLAGAWIEISLLLKINFSFMSLPSRERGLKFLQHTSGVSLIRSLPSRERGLKLNIHHLLYAFVLVAPLAGAWIEIGAVWSAAAEQGSRSPRGSVD